MKRYLLLRNNQESGPYSFEEISSLQLKPFDLIWIENSSTAWAYPTELEEFKSLVASEDSPSENKIRQEKQEESHVFISLPAGNLIKTVQESDSNIVAFQPTETRSVSELTSQPPVEEIQEKDVPLNHSIYNLWPRKKMILHNAMKLVGVFIGLAFSAFVLKKMVDGMTNINIPDEAAKPIADNMMSQSDNSPNYQHALITRIVPVSVDSAEKKHHKKAKHKDISSYVKLKANDFKVGLFGGIKNLELTVSNSSDELIDKVSVVVDILKPSGAILESKSFQFYELKPYSIQMISVPATKRGVKVHYYITNIVSRQVKAEIKMV